MPAVASDGGPVSQTIVRPSGARTIVSAPLRSTTAPYRSASVGGRLEAVRRDPLGVRPEQPCQLARVGREHGRARPRRRLELEERVGVDDRRERRMLEQLVDEAPRLRRATQARPEREAVARPRSAAQRVGRGRVLEAVLDGLEGQGLDHGRHASGTASVT